MIVSCGEALVDMVPDPVPGGGPMNVAIATARLGAHSAFVGRISNDEHGEAIWDHLLANEVDLRACERGTEPTARAIVEYSPNLSFRFEGEDTADMNLTKADLGVFGSLPQIVHGGTLGFFRGRTADTLAAMVEEYQGVVSLDPNARPQIIDDRARWDHYHERWLARTHLYKASSEDFAWIWPDRGIDDCAEELLRGNVRAVFATHGGDGVTVYLPGEEFTVPAREVEIVDTVGAGDTFVAAVLAGLSGRGLAGTPDALDDVEVAAWKSIAHAAADAAAITCTRAGADPPWASELPGDWRASGPL